MVRAQKVKREPHDTSGHQEGNDACIIPPKLPFDVLQGLILNRDPLGEQDVRAYVTSQSQGEQVVHLERMKTEYVFSRRYEVWDVHLERSRWWVISSPTNLYPQDLFPSLDYTLSLHIGVTARAMAAEHSDATPTEEIRVGGAFQRWEQAYDALARADEAEEFQAVGNHCRMALLELSQELGSAMMVPAGQPAPRGDDFVAWLDLIADTIARGESAQRVRTYLKAISRGAWQLVGWLTHAKNASRHDGRLVTEATLHVIQAFGAAVLRFELGTPDRCGQCGSYRLREIDRQELDGRQGYAVLCEKCGATAVWKAPRQASDTQQNAVSASQ